MLHDLCETLSPLHAWRNHREIFFDIGEHRSFGIKRVRDFYRRNLAHRWGREGGGPRASETLYHSSRAQARGRTAARLSRALRSSGDEREPQAVEHNRSHRHGRRSKDNITQDLSTADRRPIDTVRLEVQGGAADNAPVHWLIRATRQRSASATPPLSPPQEPGYVRCKYVRCSILPVRGCGLSMTKREGTRRLQEQNSDEGSTPTCHFAIEKALLLEL